VDVFLFISPTILAPKPLSLTPIPGELPQPQNTRFTPPQSGFVQPVTAANGGKPPRLSSINGQSVKTYIQELIEFLSVWVLVGSFITLGFCIASLRSHIDEEKLRAEEKISPIFSSPLVPEHLLTTTGLRRLKTAKIAGVVLGISLVVDIVFRHFLNS